MYKIYGRASCPFCVKAIALCRKQGEAHEFLSADLEVTKFAADLNHFTVPIIIKDRKLVGGYTELNAMLTNHNMWQKIKWWLVTGYHFFHCSQTYRTRLNARAECQANSIPKYLSGKGK